MNSTNKLLTPEQVAEILQVHVLTVYSYIRRGKFDAIRLGRSYRIDPDDLEIFVQSNKFNNGGKPDILDTNNKRNGNS